MRMATVVASVLRCALAVSALLVSTPSWAQLTTGTITGSASDTSGARVPGVNVTLINEQTGRAREAVTGPSGGFRFEFVELGLHTLKMELDGFRPEQRTGIRLDQAGEVLLLDVELRVGQLVDAVIVEAGLPNLATSTSEQRESHSGEEAAELPLARRDLTEIVDLAAGVQEGSNAGSFIMNGLGSGSLTISQDGTDATSNLEEPSTAFSGGFNTLNVVSLEAVDEVQVTKGVLPAEFGRALSGNLNVVTKSGTNVFHGSGVYMFRDDGLNARNPFVRTKAEESYKQLAASLGGPLLPRRAFFFVASEIVRSSTAGSVSATVPTDALRARIPETLPTLRRVLDLLPSPTEPTAAGAMTGTYLGPGDQAIDDGNHAFKVDVGVTDTTRVTWNYNYANPKQTIPRAAEINPRTFTGTTHRTGVGFTKFAANWSLESRVAYNRPDFQRKDGFFELQEGDEAFAGGRRLPGLRVAGIELEGEIRDFGQAPQYSFDQKLTLLQGNHALKLGGMYFRQQYSNLNLENPRFTYASIDDLIDNVPNQVRFTFGTPRFLATVNQFGLFVQDDWRVTNNLTLNLGLRWDGFGAAYAEGEDGGPPHHFNPDGFDENFVLGPFRPFDEPYEPAWLNLAPRVGFAYRVGERSVVRGGYAVMYAPITGTISRSNAVFVSPDFPFRMELSRADAARLGVGYDRIQFNEQAVELAGGPSGTPSYTVIDPALKPPYSHNFSLQVQRELPGDMTVETGYVGSRGERFILAHPYNQIDRITGERPNPSIGQGRYVSNDDRTVYHSWQSSMRKRFARGLGLNVYYTWGKVLSYGQGDVISGDLEDGFLQGFDEIRNNRGPAPADVEHDLKWNAVYELPRLLDSAPLMRWALGGWMVSGIYHYRSGTPLTIIQGSSAVGTRPDLVSGVDPVLGIQPDLVYLTRDAFQPVPTVSGVAVRPGNLGRGTVRGPSAWTFDLSFGKTFAFADRYRIQMRADLLNAFNHRTYGNPNTNLDSSAFGRITTGGPPRDVQISARLTF